MNGVGNVCPIGDVNSAILPNGHGDRTKTLVAAREDFTFGFEGCTARLKRKRFQQVIAPGGADQRVGVFRGPANARTIKQTRRRLTSSCNHAERARKFAIPCHERMQAAAAVSKLVAVVAALNDVKQAAGRTTVGIVNDREEVAKVIECQRERIPETGGEAFELRAVAIAFENIPAFAATAHRRPIFAFQRVWQPEILAEADVERAAV